jgi:hypothetical protein
MRNNIHGNNKIINDNEEGNGVKNRYKNAALYLDSLIKENIIDKMEGKKGVDYNFLLTSDHGEFLGEYGRLGHTIDDFHDEQVHIGAMYCSNELMGNVGIVSNHIDVLSSMIEPYIGYNVFVGDGLHRSMYQEGIKDSEMWTFSVYPWNSDMMLSDGTIKYWSEHDIVTDMFDNELGGDNQKRVEKLRKIWARYIEDECEAYNGEGIYLLNYVNDTEYCLDRKNPSDGGLHLYKCWSDGWNQRWFIDLEKGVISMNISDEDRVEYLGILDNKEIHNMDVNERIWTYDEGFIMDKQSKECINMVENKVVLGECVIKWRLINV